MLSGDGRPLEFNDESRKAGKGWFSNSCKSFDKQVVAVTLSKPVGVVAQLVEHHNGIVGVRGSNPLGSTIR